MDNIIVFTDWHIRRVEDINMAEITKDRMLEIENITKGLLADADFEKSPYVDIVSIVKKAGFEVEPREMDIETTGCLLVDDENDERLIMVNTFFKNPENENDVVFKKSRFITAHEYGHAILHKEKGGIYAHRDTYHRTEPKELEADFFARSILMPLQQFKVYYDILNEMSENDEDFIVEMLSKLYKVTRNKVRKRVGDLLILNQ